MSTYTHVTAPTQFIEANGVRYAYRQFGQQDGIPLVFLQHFRGGLDNWDPLITDGLAKSRPIILVNYAGVASSTGEPATTVDGMADGIADFIKALALPTSIDLLGFSIGGFVAQSVTHRYPELVRRLILVGTGPRNGESPNDPKIFQVAGNPIPTVEDFLYLFFSPSEKSQNAGRNFWNRRQQRQDADPPSSIEVLKAQMSAIIEWSQPSGERYAYLKEINQPTLVVNGHHDIMVPTINSFILQQNIPNAHLILYPDSGHGSHFQYPELFVNQTSLFLDDSEL
ncbi:MAG: alpha/beta hydrolase [Acinetobacter populi]|jgi:pimeloyl-ACP methyl ester carboxylesterase|uniref:alpha/beta fold hydrolase n=1 Tax=Acinetobacter populi TaxID=1582270 RepID=UPI0023537058|nr:alpha/beta hydrolase [Acinetobacter populi]MCH4247033.1 alpha/beta hydrolase [Acinetobacter populi]